MFIFYPIFLTMMQNLIWSKTTLGDAHFISSMKWSRLVFITMTNLICIVFTLGIFIPFAKIRTLRYRIESLNVTNAGDLEQFIAAPQSELTATGEGAADLFGFDISL